MKRLLHRLFATDFQHWAVLFPRLAVGGILAYLGWHKVQMGPDLYPQLGGAMGLIGVTFAPAFWGFLAVMAEFAGGLSILFGFLTRIGAFGAAFTMFIAMAVHFCGGDDYSKYHYPLVLMATSLTFMIGGPGLISVDAWIAKKLR